ncbi:DgyrCDS4817 [Dimorphilus gyrociliatus]|uniref:DNA repair protein REV1 n=1 Tax=Dimorphilus gyrociliatus TaxID=2664684 RepID=A0A7I8VKB3_9ANNE|nr:DgyrCDS4817 [Dimorphilus gyrociliatus]
MATSTGASRGSKRKKYNTKTGFEEFGGYMSAKISKLQDQFHNIEVDKESTGIFHGVSIYVNGYTEPSSDVLKKIMKENGGIYHHYYSRRYVSHIIATNLPNGKIDKLTDQKIVKAAWITESVKEGKLLPYTDFLVVPPNQKNQKTLTFTKTVTFDKKAQSNEESPTKNKNFVSDFYSRSRLHHISNWGAEFKEYVNSLQKQEDRIFPERENLQKFIQNEDLPISSEAKLQKIYMHVDMDCFFVSVGLRNKPDLKGKPVAVTHSKGGKGKGEQSSLSHSERRNFEKNYYNNREFRGKKTNTTGMINETEMFSEHMGEQGKEKEEEEFYSMAEIASCSYEARKAGVKNGMLMGKAKKLCPELQTINYDFEGYSEVARILYDTVASFTHDIEAVSCDEMLIDCVDVLADTGASPMQFATYLRETIREKTGCNASIGIGKNLLLARLATKKAKPNGQFLMKEEESLAIIKELPVRNLPGVGWALGKKLDTLNIKTCGDLQTISLDVLQKEIGNKTAINLIQFSKGIDDRTLKSQKVRKSVSAEINYGIRFKLMEEADEFLSNLSQELSNRLQNIKAKTKCLTLKLKIRSEGAPKETAKFLGHGICDTVAKSTTIAIATDESQIIDQEVCTLLRMINPTIEDMRGVGIQATKLQFPAENKSIPKVNYGADITKFTVKSTKQNSINPVNSDTKNSLCNDNKLKIREKSISPETLPPLPFAGGYELDDDDDHSITSFQPLSSHDKIVDEDDNNSQKNENEGDKSIYIIDHVPPPDYLSYSKVFIFTSFLDF